MKCVGTTVLTVLVIISSPGICGAQQWAVPQLKLPDTDKHPLIACTAAELERLKAAYRSSGPEHDVVAAVVSQADKVIDKPIEFPPRGGQHNQWYQCEACQLGLETIDDTHHRCPGCGRIYSGEPYDDVIFGRKHVSNLKNMLDAAWAYAITGQTKYADFAARVLLGYAQRYQVYPLHSARRRLDDESRRLAGHIFEQTLNEATHMTRHIAPAYDLIYDSGVLSQADHDRIKTELLLPMLTNITKNKLGKTNWQTWHNAAMFWGGVLVEDLSWLRKAIADPENGFAFQMKVSVSDEGMWYENSFGYHFYTLEALTGTAEGARRIGINLWDHPLLKNMFTLPARYTMADGSLPRFGDDVNSSIGEANEIMEAAYHACGDRVILSYLAAEPTWESVLLGRKVGKPALPPALCSEVFDSTGHAVLRSRGRAGLTAAVTFAPYGGFHGHYDKVSFVFFGFGKELGVDPGRAASQAYRLPIHNNWYKATISHNAIIVNRQSQEPAGGKLQFFTASDSYTGVLASCDDAYPGVTHKRLLVLTPTYLLVFDDLAGDKQNRFDWVYHNRGLKVTCDAAGRTGFVDCNYPGLEYIKNIKQGTTDDCIRVGFYGENVTTYMTMAGQADTEVLIGDGPSGSVLERVPCAMITRYGRGVNFACVLEPVAGNSNPTITNVLFSHERGTARITVVLGENVDIITLSPANKLEVKNNGIAVLP